MLERLTGCCPSNHILSAKSAPATGDSAASTDPPPPPFRTVLLRRKTLRSQRLNRRSKHRRLMRSLPALRSPAERPSATVWVGNPFTKAARMSFPSMYLLCAMASRKCGMARSAPSEFRRRCATYCGRNIQKLEGCGAGMRKSLHGGRFAGECAVIAVLVPARGVVILTTRLRHAKRLRRRIC